MANKTIEHSKGYASAVKYYPKYWSDERLSALVEVGKLYDWEYKEVTGKDYNQSSEVEATADEENVSE